MLLTETSVSSQPSQPFLTQTQLLSKELLLTGLAIKSVLISSQESSESDNKSTQMLTNTSDSLENTRINADAMALIAVLMLLTHGVQDSKNAQLLQNAALMFGAPRTNNAYLKELLAVTHPRKPAQIKMETHWPACLNVVNFHTPTAQ
jgi:hypothetical protein